MAQPSSQPVTFPSDGLRLSGALHVPDDLRPGERRGAIVMMHGFMFVNADPRVANTLRSWLDRFFPARRAVLSC